jgi:hypothetical protein
MRSDYRSGDYALEAMGIMTARRSAVDMSAGALSATTMIWEVAEGNSHARLMQWGSSFIFTAEPFPLFDGISSIVDPVISFPESTWQSAPVKEHKRVQ